MDLNNLTIQKARLLLEKREISAEELTKFYLDRIEKEDDNPPAGGIGAFLSIDKEGALKRAKEIDNDPLAIGHKTLAGIPFAIKDNIAVEGLDATAGSKILENYKAVFDATATKKLKDAGAIILGKTNLDEFAMGSSTENSAFKKTRNPRDVTRVPGGSSGGSAAAVAADFCVAAVGSDTGGSVRQPAAFCGVVGLKPTYGTVSRYGLISMASSLDQIGPITKSVEDAEILFNVIKGHDVRDATTYPDTRYQTPDTRYDISKMKIGLPKEYFGEGLDKDVKEKVLGVAKKLEKLGAKIEEISLPFSKYALNCYYIVMPAEVSANLARYDGIRYGYSTLNSKLNFWDIYFDSRGQGFGKEARRRIMLGTYVLSHGYYDAYYLKAQRVRRLLLKDFKKAFEKVDLIVTPTSPTPAFKFGEKTSDPLSMYLSDIYTVSINLAAIPALSLNAGFVEREGKKLPVGVQLIGNLFDEPKIFYVGKRLEKE